MAITMDIGKFLIIIIIFGCVYFIPTIVANSRKHYDVSAIFITNFLLGWTILGWVFSLVWALKKPKSRYC